MKDLDTWNGLNDALRDATEEYCQTLLTAEQAGKARPTFIRRIYSRLNRVRAIREREELARPVKKARRRAAR